MPTKDKKVLIIYALQDKINVSMLCHLLEKRDIPCWIAPRDIRPGETYGNSIIKAIETAEVIVVVLTETSNKSEFVAREVARCASLKKRIIPLVIGKIELSRRLEPFLENIEWLRVNITKWKSIDPAPKPKSGDLHNYCYIEGPLASPAIANTLDEIENSITGRPKIPTKILISSVSENKTDGFLLCGLLEKQGLSCGIASPDTSEEETNYQAFEKTVAVIVILTDQAIRPIDVAKIQNYIIKKPIIPFRIGDVEPPSELDYLPWIQMSAMEWESMLSGFSESGDQNIEASPQIAKVLDDIVASMDPASSIDISCRMRTIRKINPRYEMPARKPKISLPFEFIANASLKTKERATQFLSSLKKTDTPPKTSIRGMMPEIGMDLVHLSITSPPVVVPHSSYLMTFWAHLESQRQEVKQRAQDGSNDGEIQIQSQGPVKVERGNILTVEPRIHGFIIDPPQKTILWEGEIGNAGFAVNVPEDAEEGDHIGICDFHINGLRVATLHFLVHVGTKVSDVGQIATQENRIRRAFASYASADRDEVLARIQGLQKAVPDIEVFLDIASLRSGQKWQKQLKSEILKNDVLYLFWSKAASESKWVDHEWRLGYNERGINFIDPFPLISPEIVLPPQELAELHFNDWTLAYLRTDNCLNR